MRAGTYTRPRRWDDRRVHRPHPQPSLARARSLERTRRIRSTRWTARINRLAAQEIRTATSGL